MKFIPYVLVTLILTACSHLPGKSTIPGDGRRVDIAWGKTVYDKNCARCHDTGINGAQIIGDVEGWRSRIAQGIPTLVSHAIQGYSGALGYMPPRGGNPYLSQEDVAAATYYIVTVSSAK